MKNSSVNANNIYEISYPDFVAFIEQENSPPGGLNTIEYWIKNGDINNNSCLLDAACSTGFSSRNIVKETSCKAIGVDISDIAIEVAKKKTKNTNLVGAEFHCQDTAAIKFPDGLFSHITIGCSLGFITEREKSLQEFHRILGLKGKLCTANFYFTKQPPLEISKEVEEMIGFLPNPDWTAEYWNKLISKYFNLVDETDMNLPVLSDDVILWSILEQTKDLDIPSELKLKCQIRLFKTRKILNEQRLYQRYAMQIWERR